MIKCKFSCQIFEVHVIRKMANLFSGLVVFTWYFARLLNFMAEKFFWHLPQKIVGQSKMSWIFYEVAFSLANLNGFTKYLLKLHPWFFWLQNMKKIYVCMGMHLKIHEFINIFAPLRISLISKLVSSPRKNPEIDWCHQL